MPFISLNSCPLVEALDGNSGGLEQERQYNSTCSKIFWDFIEYESIKSSQILSKRRQRGRQEGKKKIIPCIGLSI